MTSVNRKYVYSFQPGAADGDAGSRELLGGKGANLAEMALLRIPVPPGFTISTDVCTHVMNSGGAFPDSLEPQIDEALERIENTMRMKFGDKQRPLLLSVRSGARVSMPGMMDTVLNIGLNDEIVAGLARVPEAARWAYDCYRRFIQMYSNVVMGMDGEILERIVRDYKRDSGYTSDVELGGDDWRLVIGQLQAAIAATCSEPVPQEPREQLMNSIGAVFRSWNTPRAITYRKINRIPDDWGTATNVMAMVFGNRGDDSGTGVTFTRNPATGERGVYGEFLLNAQGEDVVAGIRTPGPLAESSRGRGNTEVSLESSLPALYGELVETLGRLERHFRDVQDVEFTIESGRLWILQTRSGKRTGQAAVRIALDLLDEGILSSPADALMRVDADTHIPQLLHTAIDPDAKLPAQIVSGLAASPGVAVGQAVFTATDAETRASEGADVVLVRQHTSADDVHGMHAARGILTATGGLTSHAAVVARSMGVPCVCGASEVEIDADNASFSVNGTRVAEGDWITLDGTSGTVYPGQIQLVEPAVSGDFERFMEIADRYRRLEVRANADTPEDARRARELGAAGIGLCRTEHMFFATDERLSAMRSLILSDNSAQRAQALDRLLPFQRDDLAGLFRVMDGLPVTVRLLDPPLHEFLPTGSAEIAQLAQQMGRSAEQVTQTIQQMHEANPMLGFRGCRIGVVNPEVYRMQVRAIIEGAVAVKAEGFDPRPEIMVPLVALATELAIIREYIDETAAAVIAASGIAIEYSVGTMIELPRAALAAGEIARYADFFSFGTNDLTQTGFGLSRDDAARFLPAYLAGGLLRDDPFVSLDTEGIGELIRIAVERGRATRPDIKLGICGEHGGDPRSVAFCDSLGLNYVSCSAFRVPGARLAAAQAGRG